jgi:hypothetical protein
MDQIWTKLVLSAPFSSGSTTFEMEFQNESLQKFGMRKHRSYVSNIILRYSHIIYIELSLSYI